MNDEPELKQSGPYRLRWKRRLLQLILIGVALMFGLSFTAERPKNLGVVAGQLYPCPDSPNCVSTTATRPEQTMPPIEFEGSAADAMQRLLEVVNATPRVKLVSQSDNYLYIECVSLVFRFVDDVEFLIDEENGRIDFRSASRVGYSDLGANRRRMNSISERFHQ